MRCGPFDFVQDTTHVRENDKSQPFSGTGSHPPAFIKGRNHSVEGIVLTEKQKFIFTVKVVVKICGRKPGCRGNVAHPRFRKTARLKFLARGAQDIQSARQIPLSEAAISSAFELMSRQALSLHSF
jgi:hypothetical protein